MANLKDTTISGNLAVTGAANINNGAQISGADVTFLNTGTGDSPALIFQRGTLSDNYNDWKVVDTGGNLVFQQRGSGSSAWTNEVAFSTSGQVTATGFTGDGTNLTNVLHSVVAGTGLTGGTVSDGGTIALDTTRALTTADITTGTDTTNKLVSAKTLADALGGLGGGTVTSVGLSNASGESDFTISGSPVTTAGTITIEHANSVTAKSTQAVYPITFDKHGHITGSGSAVTVPTASDTYSSTSSDVMTGKGVNAALQTLDSSISATTGQAISAITITDGKISASSKIAVGDANQNAFSNVKVGSTTIAADTTTDTLELVAGTDITLTPDATNDKVTIAFSNASGYTKNTGTVTSVGLSNASGESDFTIGGSPITGSGTLTIEHANSVTAQTTQALYPIKFDKHGHITGSGSAVTVPTKVSDLTNDSGFLTASTGVTTFNGSSGAITYTAPVTSVNTQTGAVVLDADDVGALPDTTTYAASPSVGGSATFANGVHYAQVDSTSTSTAFTAQIPGITSYYDGLTVILYNGKVTSASGYTININGLGAYGTYNNMALGNPVTPTDPTRDTTIFNVNYAMIFVYCSNIGDRNVTGWICYRGYDANTNTVGYQLRTNSYVLNASDAFRYYKILFTSADGTKWVPASANTTNSATSAKVVNQRPINPFGEIVYCGNTTSYTAGAALTATAIWQQYTLTLGYSFNRTGAALTLTTKKPVYVKCAPQSDGSAIIDADSPYVQDLPTTEDGKIYILLGMAYSATAIELLMNHPVYYYKNGAIRLWTNASDAPVQSVNGQTGAVTVGTVTSVGISNAMDGGLSVSGSPVTESGSITVGHSNVLTNAQTTQAVYPIAIDKNGHVSSYGTSINPIADPTTKSSGQYLKYNGTNWVADNVTAGVSDVQVNGTSILSSGVANIVTNTAYNSSSNKVATMTDITNAVPNNSNWVNGSATGSVRTVGSKEESSTYTIGVDAVAEGHSTKASGYAAHAEGYATSASGMASHAEGYSTASGNYSHAEGDSTASGTDAHAEGDSTASGNYSHAEGYNSTASGVQSHAEGNSTTASGLQSHAEGYVTIASRRSQHVFGEYNIEDTYGTDENSKGLYVEIVGKGVSDATRSNARTLDWDGNETLSGYIMPSSLRFESSNIVDSTASIYEFGGPNATLLQFSQQATVDDGSILLSAVDYFNLPVTNPYVDSGANDYVIITTKNVSDITNTAYNASTNKVATMTDINNAMTVVTFTPDSTNNNLIISVQLPSSIQNGNEVNY